MPSKNDDLLDNLYDICGVQRPKPDPLPHWDGKMPCPYGCSARFLTPSAMDHHISFSHRSHD